MENTHGCCGFETNMVKCVVTALEKMKDMFVSALCNHRDPSCEPSGGDVTDPDRRRTGFRGNPMASNVLRMFCMGRPKSDDGRRPDRDVVPLMPGEVNLRGDRATFHLGQNADQPVPVGEDGRPAGPVYYHDTRPTDASSPCPGKSDGAKQQDKRVIQVLPSLPASTTNRVVGPVTGLPVGDDEHVFTLQLNKRYGEQPDEKARLQIEIRLPEQRANQRTDTDTQYLETDLPLFHAVPETKRKRNAMKKKKKGVGGRKFGGKKWKK